MVDATATGDAATGDAATGDAATRAEAGPGDSAPPKQDSAIKPDSAPPKLDGAPPSGVVLRVTFDKAPLGQYTDSAIKSEWKWIKWSSGLKQGRVHIVAGAQSKSGRSLRIFYPKNTRPSRRTASSRAGGTASRRSAARTSASAT